MQISVQEIIKIMPWRLDELHFFLYEVLQEHGY